MTQEEFKREIQRMVGLRFYPASMVGHWEVVRDRLPLSVLSAAVERALMTRTDFPTPVELLQDADAVKHYARPTTKDEDRGVELREPLEFTAPELSRPIRVTREWKYYCEECSDSGWASFWCGRDSTRSPWNKTRRCERHGEHGEHDYAAKCACWAINPALIRKRENQGRYAAQEKAK